MSRERTPQDLLREAAAGANRIFDLTQKATMQRALKLQETLDSVLPDVAARAAAAAEMREIGAGQFEIIEKSARILVSKGPGSTEAVAVPTAEDVLGELTRGKKKL